MPARAVLHTHAPNTQHCSLTVVSTTERRDPWNGAQAKKLFQKPRQVLVLDKAAQVAFGVLFDHSHERAQTLWVDQNDPVAGGARALLYSAPRCDAAWPAAACREVGACISLPGE